MKSRKATRLPLPARLEARCALTGTALGRVVDISLHGLRLETAAPLELDRQYCLAIEADASLGTTQPWRIDARCAWIGTDVDPPRLLAGLEFAGVGPAQQKTLVTLMHHLIRG